MIINDFHKFHNYESEIAGKIIELNKKKGNIDMPFEVEHKYIDFSSAIIGDKIKEMDNVNSKEEIRRFDDIYITQLMLKCDESKDDFYLQESVQKIIDF